MQSPDVIVIGAGAAGLAAADELSRKGARVLILEARDRIGGRCWTRRIPGLTIPVELGAEFIHGEAKVTHALLKRAGLTAVESVRDDVPGDAAAAELRRQLGGAFRPIPIGPGLMTYLDQVKRRDFLRKWHHTLFPVP